ncbi:MAG: M23 family metallopeptidase [Desulfovibrio sp.]|nr:M23 family metallopeptidase [Desulfovibrio sp.]
MFAYEIDFTQDPGKGDFLTVLVEKKYHEGVYRGYGRILAACLRYKGKMHEAFLFRDGNGPARYYTRKGENLRRNFLQAPLAVTRITSNFSKNRMHPILGYSRPHEGIDYAAPMGTPVKAVGDGEIAAQGWVSGYGNQVVITHAGGLESLYSHLAGFARGINKGTHVQQGQTIGYVGSTGLSTGPHLDFRLRLNGKFINPAVKINPRNAPVSAKNMAAFLRTMNKELRLLNGHSSFSEYNSNDLVPEMVRVGK